VKRKQHRKADNFGTFVTVTLHCNMCDEETEEEFGDEFTRALQWRDDAIKNHKCPTETEVEW
jgi:hypothetical protein